MTLYNIDTQSQFSTFFDVAVLPALQLSPLAGIFDGLNGLSALAGGFIAPLAPDLGDGFSFTHLAQQEHSSYAIFDVTVKKRF